MLAAVLLFLGLTLAAMAAHLPSSLDLRVDALSTQALLTQPASKLLDPERQAAAVRRAHWTLIGFVLIQLFEAGALLYLWSSGGAARLRDWLRRRAESEWNLRFAFGAMLALVARLAALIPSFYLYRVDHALGVTSELTRVWALFWIVHTVVAMLIAGSIAAIVLWLATRTHFWYVFTIAGVLAASVAWSYVSQSAQRPSLAAMTAGEVRYAQAFELGRIVQGDAVSIALIEGGIIIVFSALAVVVADRIGFRRDDDPLSRLAIVGALLALVYLAAVPVRNATLRSYDFGDDAYAVSVTRDPAGAVRALIRQGDRRMEEVCPEPIATLFLYTQPGIGARVAAINRVPSGCP